MSARSDAPDWQGAGFDEIIGDGAAGVRWAIVATTELPGARILGG